MASLRSWIGSILSLVVFFIVARLSRGLAAPTFVAITFACVYLWLLVLRVPELKAIQPAEPDEATQPPPKSSQDAEVSSSSAPVPKMQDREEGNKNSSDKGKALPTELPLSAEQGSAARENDTAVQPSSSSASQPAAEHKSDKKTAVVNEDKQQMGGHETGGQQPVDNEASSETLADVPVEEEKILHNEGESIGAQTREGAAKLDMGQSSGRTSGLPHDSDDESEDDDEEMNPDNEEDEHADAEKAQELKLEGNEFFKANKLHDAREAYSEALYLTPAADKKARSVLHANRAACLQKLSRWQDVVDDCKHAVDLDPTYAKAYLRRSAAYEAMEKWHDANEDLKKAIELDPTLKSKEYKRQSVLEHRAQVQFEKDKEEMMDKLKGFGNMVLGKFGMSTDNFKCEKDPDSGSYSIKFNQ